MTAPPQPGPARLAVGRPGAGGGAGVLRRVGGGGGGVGGRGAGGGAGVLRRRGRGERGGAVSLWVVLMVPVSAFAAVVAMAGPQRLAAESSMQEAADDLAMFTVAWRDGAADPTGAVAPYPPDCDGLTQAHQNNRDDLETEYKNLTGDPADGGRGLPPTDDLVKANRDEKKRLDEQIDRWENTCRLLAESLMRDLGHLGLEAVSLRGTYSDSLKGSTDPVLQVPCLTASATAERDAIKVHDAVHVALAADWGHAGWAAAQVWRDGLPMAAESIGRLSQYEQSATDPECGEQLQVLDSQGRPVWVDDPGHNSRKLVESVPRTALSN